jgi:hypothetical protein
VTNGYLASESQEKRWPRRVVVPLALVTSAVVVIGCMRAPDTSTNRIVQTPPEATATPAPPPLVGLGQEDPRLGMQAVAGKSADDVETSSIQVLPDGNIRSESSAAAEQVSPTTITQWVKSLGSTTLWSGSDSSAAAFTDVPLGSFFRVTGPQMGDRLPVYYVGDGLLRLPGDGWVEAASVDTVDAPAPGQVPGVDADARNLLPVWVQAHRGTKLMSGPDDNAVSLTDLPQWTFLKAAGVERNGQLLVNYAGDYATRQPGIGWVDQSSVGPAGDPGTWVSNFRATALWSGVDDNAVKFTDLPQWTKLRIVDGAANDPQRIQVEFFGDGFSRKAGTAWIAVTDVGPITPPVPLPSVPIPVPSGTQQMQHQTFGSGEEFIDAVGSAAQISQKSTGVPASVTVAQAILESDWGRSRLTRQGNNLFGIKALNGPGPEGVVTLATWEHTPSGDVIVQAPFRAYTTLEQSIDDHGKFFNSNKRYAGALAVADDPRAFAHAIQDAGYATDPGYAGKLIKLMDKYNLYRFDG